MRVVGPVPVHLACVALVAADMLARAIRIRILVSRLGGGPLSLRDAFRLNLLGDAAAELSPFRLAGEPSRVGALLQSGVAAKPALMAVGAEMALSYGMVALLVVAASWTMLPAWWSSIAPAMGHAARLVPPWAMVLVAAAVVWSLRFVSRRTAATASWAAEIRSSLRTLGGIRTAELAGLFALGALNIAARVGILWMLVAPLPGAPPPATVLVGSFVLLFGQAFSPTPSGIGVVEMGMLGGAAGGLGGHAIPVLVYWRAYTALLPILLAAVFAVPRFGVRPFTVMLGLYRKSTSQASASADTLSAAPCAVGDLQ